MEDHIALFPLKMVPFPGEMINLHIFEPRYKELIQDVLEGNRQFGIPPFIDKKIDYGTLMEVVEVARRYDDGRMDITTRGIHVFKIIDYQNPAPGKQYAMGYVEYLPNEVSEDPLMKSNLLERVEEFFTAIHEIGKVQVQEDIKSYDVIHKLGLPIESEYELLQMDNEIERQEFIINYLDQVLPALKKAEKAREIIKMNGHFKYFDPINF